MKRYRLKNFDTELLAFAVETSVFGELKITVEDANTELRHVMPMPLVADPTSAEGLKSWIESRVVPKNRAFVDELFRAVGLEDTSPIGVIDYSMGLSVNDSFWVVPDGFSGTWEQYNLFENDLDEALSLVAYTGHTSSQRHDAGLSTEWTVDGQFPKAWRRVNGELRLYKAGTEGAANTGMEPYSEFFAAQLADALGIPHVDYRLDVWKGKLASVCPLMHDSRTSLVPFWAATRVAKYPDTLAISRTLGSGVFNAVRDMYLFDALICNTDRHASNFGFLRDSATGQMTGLAPLFDHNVSLFRFDMEGDYSLWPQRGAELRPANVALTFDRLAEQLMGERQRALLRKLVDFRFVNDAEHPVDEKRLHALNNYIHQRILQFLAMKPVDERLLRRMIDKHCGETGVNFDSSPILHLAKMR